MKLFHVFLLGLYYIIPTYAQTIKLNDGLVAYFPFDGYPITDKSGNGNRAVMGGDTLLGCGAEGNAIRFDGITSESIIIGPAIFDNFKTADFSISFYMKSGVQVGTISSYDIFAKRKKCSTDSSFAIRYTPTSNQISVELYENQRKNNIIVQRLDYARCWQHIVVTRAFNKLTLYVNGRATQTNLASSRVAINNDAPLTIAKSPCIGTTDRKFSGYLDEFRIYDRAINEAEVAALYRNPDRIANRDTIVFLGSSVTLGVTTTCATDFLWSPKEGVSNEKSATTTITPSKGGVFNYILAMKEQQCTALDTIKIKVIDPKDLECTELFLPKAFTPNGDGLNDQFFISNPYAVDEVLSFEVLDGWGGRMFYTQDRFERWDGSFNGQKLTPGVFLWKAKYKCKGVEKTAFGSITLLK
jgi:gliding motility-associated-like protein